MLKNSPSASPRIDARDGGDVTDALRDQPTRAPGGRRILDFPAMTPIPGWLDSDRHAHLVGPRS
jgi:hypothetical protein